MKTSHLTTGGKVFFYGPPKRSPVEMVVLMGHGPLCVARVYDHLKGELVVGLYWIYIMKHGAHIGPFFADIHLAYKAMKKIMKHFGENFFDQPLDWIRRQEAARVWMDKNVGKLEDLIGAEWLKTDGDSAIGEVR